MKRKKTNARVLSFVLCNAMLAGALTGCQANGTNIDTSETEQTSQLQETPIQSQGSLTEAPGSALEGLNMGVEANRANYTELAKELEQLYRQNPEDTELALAYAEKLMQLGDMSGTREVVTPLLAADTPEGQAFYLAAQIEYISGNYTKAEALYQTLLNEYPEYETQAMHGLEYIYYQTNQYQKAQALSTNANEKTEIGAMMEAFGNTLPYQISWDDEEETAIPFTVTDPLPVIPIEINGEVLNFIIDSGADDTYISESVAKGMGIEPVASLTGEYAGGVEVTTEYGILDAMKLNGVTLESVPIIMADVAHFSTLYDFEVHGVIGTGLFRQFVATMDYINGELILKPRGTQVEAGADGTQVPFVMAASHFMLCDAIINGEEMKMFLDSGLATDASLLLPTGAMDYAGISLPEMKASEGAGGLGGSDFSVGYFTADTYQMGEMPTVTDMLGMYGMFPEAYYFSDAIGVFVDGIISHNYLKDYKWTIDYDSMMMTFSK